MTLDQIISAALARRALSKVALATRMGVSRQAVYAWADGSSRPTLARLSRLATELDVPIDDLVAAMLAPSAVVAASRDDTCRPCSGGSDGSTSSPPPSPRTRTT